MVICIDTLHRSGGAAPLVRLAGYAVPAGRLPAQHETRDRLYDGFRFLREWLRDPIATAAVAPSGKALTSLMTSEIHAGTGPVLELGPGTGAFTQGLVMRGVAECDLTLVERNPIFAQLLRERFPRATVLGIDAADLNLPSLNLPRQAGPHAFGAAVCGLGLRSMDSWQVEAILRAVFMQMRPGAALYLFTYGPRCSVPEEVLHRLSLVAHRRGTTLRNVPPASVYRIAHHAGGR